MNAISQPIDQMLDSRVRTLRTKIVWWRESLWTWVVARFPEWDEVRVGPGRIILELSRRTEVPLSRGNRENRHRWPLPGPWVSFFSTSPASYHCSSPPFALRSSALLTFPSPEIHPASSQNALELALILLKQVWINQECLCPLVDSGKVVFVLWMILGFCKRCNEIILRRHKSWWVSPIPNSCEGAFHGNSSIWETLF